jgi:hypothetical protein
MYKIHQFQKDDKKIILPMHIYHKMLAYARCSEGEISGFGRTKIVHKDGTTLVTILEIRIFKQVVSSGHTDLDKGALAQFYVELVREKQNPANWNLWWHSHNDFGVFFSGTDNATIRELSHDSKLYSVCINKNGNLVGRYDAFGQEHEELEVEAEHLIKDNMMEACRKEVAEKVTQDTFAPEMVIRSHRIYSPAMESAIKEDIEKGVDEIVFDFTQYPKGPAYYDETP